MFVSVIIPIYNTLPYLKRCVTSVLEQTDGDFELILVDDGSSDGSGAMCDEFAARDRRVQVIHQKNSGVSSARNNGISHAKGDYLLFLDSDDWYERTTVAELRKAAEEFDTDIVLFEWAVVTEDGRAPTTPVRASGEITPSEAVFLTASNRNSFVWSKLFRRCCYEGIRFREDIYWGEDTLFSVQCITKARKCAYLSRPLYNYYMSEVSATRGVAKPEKQLSVIKSFREIRTLVDGSYPEHSLPAADTYYMHYINCLKNPKIPQTLFGEIAKTLQKELRKDYGKILFCGRITARHKIKMLSALICPKIWRKKGCK